MTFHIILIYLTIFPIVFQNQYFGTVRWLRITCHGDTINITIITIVSYYFQFLKAAGIFKYIIF